MNTTEIEKLATELAKASPKEILSKAFSLFDNIAISFSGAEDVALIELATKISKKVSVFTLDTGRLHPETYRFLEKVRTHYNLPLEVLTPEPAALEKLTREKGLFSFFEDGHSECCGIRKVAPLRKKLATLDAWITGQRKDQSPSTRNKVAIIELDPSFGTTEKPLVKFNPLANWSSTDVWNYIRMFDVPFNELHHRGFISIGCEPCTKAVFPSQHEREGRWWWEEETLKECGLHAGASDTD